MTGVPPVAEPTFGETDVTVGVTAGAGTDVVGRDGVNGLPPLHPVKLARLAAANAAQSRRLQIIAIAVSLLLEKAGKSGWKVHGSQRRTSSMSNRVSP
jgi:hypothetical protein